MRTTSGKHRIIFPVSLAFVMCASQAHADCSRDDVEFYLNKGFSTDQITELCRTLPDKDGPDKDVTQKEQQTTEQGSATETVDNNELFLKTAIKGQDIYLSNDSLHYTQKKMCIEYGEEDLYGFTPKVCPDVKFTVVLKGLEVLTTGKKYGFYGQQEVQVRSTIKRDIIGDLKDQKPKDRELILDTFEQGDKTAIPIRDDFSLERVKQVLQQLAE